MIVLLGRRLVARSTRTVTTAGFLLFVVAAFVVLPVDEYEAWVEQTRADIKEAQTGLADQREQREEEAAAK